MPRPDADLRQLHERLGRLSPPVDVRALPTHGFVVAFRVELERGARILPPGLALREVPGTGQGLVCMSGGEFPSALVGKLALPAPPHQDLHCCAIIDHEHAGATVPAGYTLHYEASSRIVELASGHLSKGLRRGPSRFERAGAGEDDAERWAVSCSSREPLCCMSFETRPLATSWTAPETTVFGSARAASEFLLDLAGHVVHDYTRDRTSFRARDPRHCEARFCRDFDFEFPLIKHLDEQFDLALELDCALFISTRRPARVQAEQPRTHTAESGDSAQLPAGC